MTLGHADRLAAGDVLFRQTTPVYGVLFFPVLLGIYERQFGLITLWEITSAGLLASRSFTG